MDFKIQFTRDEAINMLKNIGLKVEFVEMPFWFENPHGDGGYNEMIPVWMVTNPHNGERETVVSFFNRYIANKKTEMFLTPEKLEIYNLFER